MGFLTLLVERGRRVAYAHVVHRNFGSTITADAPIHIFASLDNVFHVTPHIVGHHGGLVLALVIALDVGTAMENNFVVVKHMVV